jgi:hypothetical protein
MDVRERPRGTATLPTRPAVLRSDPLGPWAFDYDRLLELAADNATGYRTSEPFGHAVLDGVFPDTLLDEVVARFPVRDDPGWSNEDKEMQRKQQWRDAKRMPPVAASFIAMLQSASWISFLEELTGTRGLIGDPHCYHGGLHQSWAGGYLKVHADQPLQPRLGLQRRLNVIIYLNRDWSLDWGGELELWDDGMTRCVERIAPSFNRTVVFDGVGTHHGHPDPLRTPIDVPRRSIAAYYYVSGREQPDLPLSAAPRAVFRPRPSEVIVPAPQRSRWKRTLHGVRRRLG